MYMGWTESASKIAARRARIVGTSKPRADRNKAIRAQLQKWSEKDLRALLKAIESVSKAGTR